MDNEKLSQHNQCDFEHVRKSVYIALEKKHSRTLKELKKLKQRNVTGLGYLHQIVIKKNVRWNKMKEKNNILEPKQYFDDLKERINNIDDKYLTKFFEGCLQLVPKYEITGQKRIISKLRFLVDCVEKEREIVKLGINKFVYRDDIEEYIDNITKNVVKIIELENYPRDIPDEIVEVIDKTKNIFDQLYVVFTDYTGEIERKIERERREKDPILFGTFQKKISNRGNETIINDRFYYLGDWEDEYCDLTMDKFLAEVGKEKLQIISTPVDVESIRNELNRLDDNFKITVTPQKKSFFKKIKSVLKK